MVLGVYTGDPAQVLHQIPDLREHAEVIVPKESITGCVSLGSTMSKPLVLPIYVTGIALEVDDTLGVLALFKDLGKKNTIIYDHGDKPKQGYFLVVADGPWDEDWDRPYFLVTYRGI